MRQKTDIEEMLSKSIRQIPDYPKKGILFRDITPLLKDPAAFRLCIDEFAKRLSSYNIDYIAGIEARGFIFGAALAYRLGMPFIPIRKKGKLPHEVASIEYALEYGTAIIEVHKDSIERGKHVLIVDDLLATGGTAKAAAELLSTLGANIAGFAFVIELKGLNGRAALKSDRVISLIAY